MAIGPALEIFDWVALVSTFVFFIFAGIPGKAAQVGSNRTAKCAFPRTTLRGVELCHTRVKS